jgi:hypothetical protein
MCNQAVSLIAAELERRGITTVCVILLQEIAEKVRPPRALVVPFRHGFPLGAPHDPALQRRVIEAALALLARTDVPVLAQGNFTVA